MNASNLSIGDCICLIMDDRTIKSKTYSKDYVKVTAIDNDKNIITVTKDKSQLNLNCNLCGDAIKPIPVNESTLNDIGYKLVFKEHLYGIAGITVYEKSISLENGTFFEIHITETANGYVCILSKPEAMLGCEYIPVPYIHNLQNLIAKRYNWQYPIDPKVFTSKKDETDK